MNPCENCANQGLCDVGQPPLVEFEADGVFVKQIALGPVGSIVPQHSHAYDHLTMLSVGAVQVYEDGLFASTQSAPAAIKIKAGVKHTFVSLVENTLLYCIHNTARAGVVEIAEEHQIVRAA